MHVICDVVDAALDLPGSQRIPAVPDSLRGKSPADTSNAKAGGGGWPDFSDINVGTILTYAFGNAVGILNDAGGLEQAADQMELHTSVTVPAGGGCDRMSSAAATGSCK